MGLPTITVEFKTLAASAVARSIRGVLAVLIQDGTEDVAWAHKSYGTLAELSADEAAYTEENYAILARAFAAGPYQVLVVRVGSEGTLAQATAILEKLSYNWVCSPVSGFQSGLAAWVGTVNAASKIRKVKALVTGVSSANDPHVVNAANTSVTLNDAAATTVTMAEYLPRLGGVLAACPLDQSVTYYALTDLAEAAAVTNVDAAIDAGNLVLFLEDDTYRIARGVNTLVTPGENQTEDMKSIAVVEAMDLIQEDIIRTFKNNYLGKVKNSADNQALLVSDVLSYLRALAAESVLDPNSDILAEIDTGAMRKVWTAAGADVSGLTDAQVKRKTYRSYVYVTATCRILDAMEDMVMSITLQ